MTTPLTSGVRRERVTDATDQEIADAVEIVAALRRLPPERRLDALVIAAKVLIEHPDRIGEDVHGDRYACLTCGEPSADQRHNVCAEARLT